MLEALAHGTPWIALRGNPGVGKTTLARAVRRALEDAGTPTAWVGATPAVAGVPFGTIAHLLPTERAPRNQGELLDWAAAELHNRAGGGRLVVVVDDAHTLDRESAGVLAHLVATGDAALAVTLRSGASVPEAFRPIADGDAVTHIEVQAFGRFEARAMLEAELGGPVDTLTVARLTEASAGNALFLHELVAAGLQRGTLSADDGQWSWHGELAPSSRLAELVGERLETVPADVLAVLDMVALAEPIASQIVSELTSPTSFDTAVRDGLATVLDDGRRRVVRLAHPLYGEILRVRQPRTRRRELAGELARAVEATGARRRDDLLRVAVWHLDSGDSVDPDALVRAAEHAVRLFDQSLAERLARAAAEAGAGPGAYLPLGEALYWQGRFQESAAVHAAITVAEAPDAVRAESGICHSAVLLWGMDDADAATELLVGLEPTIADTAWRYEVRAQRATVLGLVSRTKDALALARTVLDEPEAGERARCRAAGTTVHTLALAGMPERALAVASEHAELALHLVDDVLPAAGSLVIGQCLALLVTGRAYEFDTLAQLLWDLSLERSVDDYRGVWAFLHGRAALARGRPRTAARRCREAADLLRNQDVGRILPWCLGVLAQAEGAAGNAAEAATAAEEAERAAGTITAWKVEIDLGRVWADAAAGERSAARALAVASADMMAARDQRSCELIALIDALRLGGGSPVARRVASVAAGIEGPLARIASELATLNPEGRDLDALSAELADLGADLLAAETAAAAAARYRSQALPARATDTLRRARDLGAKCEGAITLERLLGDPALATLTDREHEIAGFAARAMSRRAIAEQLYLSERTVGNHLHRAYAKLGVSSASELARWFPHVASASIGR